VKILILILSYRALCLHRLNSLSILLQQLARTEPQRLPHSLLSKQHFRPPIPRAHPKQQRQQEVPPRAKQRGPAPPDAPARAGQLELGGSTGGSCVLAGLGVTWHDHGMQRGKFQPGCKDVDRVMDLAFCLIFRGCLFRKFRGLFGETMIVLWRRRRRRMLRKARFGHVLL